jgi:hypothetical protein
MALQRWTIDPCLSHGLCGNRVHNNLCEHRGNFEPAEMTDILHDSTVTRVTLQPDDVAVLLAAARD